MRISVVIPLYNAEKYIKEALISVLGQTVSPYEILVVDDGSTDESGAIAREVLEGSGFQNFKIISSKNQGHSKAANMGIQSATGDYIAFLDSDDLWLESKLERLGGEAKINPLAVLLYSRFHFIDEHSHKAPHLDYKQAPIEGDPFSHLLRFGNTIYGSNSGVLVKRSSLLEVGGYDETLKACEDWDLWIRLSKMGDFRFVSEDLVAIRVHGKNQSSDLGMMMNLQLQVIRKHAIDIHEKGLSYMTILARVLYLQRLNFLSILIAPKNHQLLRSLYQFYPVPWFRLQMFFRVSCLYILNKFRRYNKF